MLVKKDQLKFSKNINEIMFIVWNYRANWFGTNSKRGTKRPV